MFELFGLVGWFCFFSPFCVATLCSRFGEEFGIDPSLEGPVRDGGSRVGLLMLGTQ